MTISKLIKLLVDKLEWDRSSHPERDNVYLRITLRDDDGSAIRIKIVNITHAVTSCKGPAYITVDQKAIDNSQWVDK